MTVAQIKTSWTAAPFVPFRIYFPGGPPVDIPHPDYLTLSPTERIAIAILPDGRIIRIDVALITALENLVIVAD